MIGPMIKKTWLFEKAEKVKDLVFAKLDEILLKLAAQDAVLGSLAANDTSVLQALVHLVERTQDAKCAAREVSSLAAELKGARGEMERTLSEFRALLAPSGGTPAGAPAVPTHRRGLLEPELALLVHLAPRLPTPVALDVGANRGDVAARLLEAGLRVHAFEPNPPTLRALRERLGGRDGLVTHGLAVGSADGSMELHLARDTSPERWFEDESLYSSLVRHAMPEQLAFDRSVTVQVRTLASLQAEGAIPADVSLVKVDTEGWDLEVLRGMGEHRYPLVMAEFWDEAMSFAGGGSRNALPALAEEMRQRGSPWFIVIYRVFPGDERVGWYCNLPDSPERSWGNVLFFRDAALFEEARRWCEATLPRAVFSKDLTRSAAPAPAAAAG